ncbi:hypothetical protein C8A01DRAFT_36167 [Parachaetomium inaequale]|uniref:Uncharacterized protein n=1 Tax=Parachaetomium inaequale TaxID=2588326 RepID=A0AAN6SR04_9PEZI|nr:hypothetical protein C8A01DRAFT_36167 [Parachaetomium inaequale]
MPFTKFISRLHNDVPPSVAAEVVEVIFATCRQYPSLMQATSIPTSLDPVDAEAEDGTMIHSLQDRQDVEMEMEAEPVGSDNTNNGSASQLISGHGRVIDKKNPRTGIEPPDVHHRPGKTSDSIGANDKGDTPLTPPSIPTDCPTPTPPTQPYTPAATPPSPLSQELVGVHAGGNIDERYIRLGVPGIFHRAFDLLNRRRISYTKNNKRDEVTLTPRQAYEIVHVFFSEMFCTTHERVEAIVSNVEAYNTACYADVASIDKSAPTAIRDLFTSLSAIAKRDKPEALDYLVQNIDSVRLRESWDKVRASLAATDASSYQYIVYLGLTPPTHGTTYVSLAKKALCRKAGISADKFTSYLRIAQVPAALTRHFGLGSLLFCPNNMSGNCHRFQYPSATDEIFGIIKSADTENLLGSWSKILQQHIVQVIWDRAPLRLAIGQGRGPTVGAEEHEHLLSCIYVLERRGVSGHVVEELVEEEEEEEEQKEEARLHSSDQQARLL